MTTVKAQQFAALDERGSKVSLRFAEVVLRTPDLDRMRDWYTLLLGHGPFVERRPSPDRPKSYVGGQERASDVRLAFFMVHEGEHPYKQVLALFEIPNLVAGSAPHPGLHHFQFRLASFEALADKFEQLAAHGSHPHRAANHGMGTSFYFRDPDTNIVELSCANYPTREEEKAYSLSEKFARNPSGVELDAATFVARLRSGVPLEQLLIIPD